MPRSSPRLDLAAVANRGVGKAVDREDRGACAAMWLLVDEAVGVPRAIAAAVQRLNASTRMTRRSELGWAGLGVGRVAERAK